MSNISLQVLKSAAGYYIGKTDSQGFPYSRNSVEYWGKQSDAQIALDTGNFTYRSNP
jgi:hypothetical protein